jgi:hypothetical protein
VCVCVVCVRAERGFHVRKMRDGFWYRLRHVDFVT